MKNCFLSNSFTHKLFPRLLSVLCLLILLFMTACAGKAQKDSLAKIKNLEFTVLSEDAIPEEMKKVIQEKNPNPFKITYSDRGFLYIGIGYGEQETGGFGITVNDLYLTENAIYFDTTLLGPSPDNETPVSDTASKKLPDSDLRQFLFYNFFFISLIPSFIIIYLL